MQTTYDVIIIGGGPSGVAAATYIARCRWTVLVIDRSMSGSFLARLGNVSYFPGFPESVSGQELLRKMRKQAELVGVHFLSDAVAQIEAQENIFQLKTDGEKQFEAKAVIAATGAASRTNYLSGEREFLGRGVSYDALADGPSVAKRSVAVVGKNSEAVLEALTLRRFADHVHFIIPSSKLEIDDALLKKLQDERSIELYFSASLKKINGKDHVNSVTVFLGGKEKEIPVVGVFTYLHEHKVTTDFLCNLVDLSPRGLVRVDHNLATSRSGIFACGDLLCGKPQIPVIATSQGLLAGISAEKYLSSEA